MPHITGKIIGFWLIPIALAVAVLSLGIWLAADWPSLSPLGKTVSILVIVAGSLMTFLVAAAIALRIMLHKLARSLARDARGIGRALNYIFKIVPTQPPQSPDEPANSDR